MLLPNQLNVVYFPDPKTLFIINAVFAFLCGCYNKSDRKLILYVNTSGLFFAITSLICFET